jgi:hypothetical protein
MSLWINGRKNGKNGKREHMPCLVEFPGIGACCNWIGPPYRRNGPGLCPSRSLGPGHGQVPHPSNLNETSNSLISQKPKFLAVFFAIDFAIRFCYN